MTLFALRFHLVALDHLSDLLIVNLFSASKMLRHFKQELKLEEFLAGHFAYHTIFPSYRLHVNFKEPFIMGAEFNGLSSHESPVAQW